MSHDKCDPNIFLNGEPDLFRRKTMCIFHKWTKWVPYLRSYSYTSAQLLVGKVFDTTDLRQSRRCCVCGFMQDRLITSNISMQRNELENLINKIQEVGK